MPHGKTAKLKSVAMTGSPVALGEDTEVINGNIGAPPSNAGAITLTGADGGTLTLNPGDWWPFVDLGLGTITATGTAPDRVDISGTGA